MKIVMVDERGKYYETEGPVEGSIFPAVKAKVAVQTVENDRIKASFSDEKLSNYMYLEDDGDSDNLYIERCSSDLVIEGKSEVNKLNVIVKNNSLCEGLIIIRGIESVKGISVCNDVMVNAYNKVVLDNCDVFSADELAYDLDYTGDILINSTVTASDSSDVLIKGKSRGLTRVIVGRNSCLLRIPESTDTIAFVPKVVSSQYVKDCNIYYEDNDTAGFIKIEQ